MSSSFLSEIRGWLRLVRSGSVVLVLLLTRNATALAEDREPAAYSQAVTQAIEELDANNLPEALAEFRRAHQIYPNARSLRGIGMVEFDLRDYNSSAQHLQEALASEIKPLAGKMRSDAEALLARALRYLAGIVIKTDPPDARVLVDGSVVEARADQPIWLNPGDHVIEVRASGRLAETRTLRVSGGDKRELSISLPTLEGRQASDSAGAAPVSSPSSPSQSELQPAYRKWWVWTLVAVAVAGGATTAAVLLSRRDAPCVRPIEGTNSAGVSLHALRTF